MYNTRQHLGLDVLTDDQFVILGNFALEKGKRIENYGDDLIIRKSYRRMDFYMYASYDEEEKAYRVYNSHIHGVSLDIWKLKIISVIGTYEFNSNICRVLCEVGERGSLQVVDLIASTVLPSLAPDTEVTAQVVAFPVFIDYYKDLEDYEKRSELKTVWKDGRSLYIDEGSILPLGFMSNHGVNANKSDGEDGDYEDDEVCIHGVVTKVEKIEFEFNEEITCEHFQVTIETHMGNLQIIHSYEQVDEEQRDLIKVGSHVDGVFWIEADPAILDYEQLVFNKERNIKAIQHAMYYGEYERMKKVLSDDVVFCSKNNADGEDIVGAQNVIDRFATIYNNAKGNEENKCYAQEVIATIEGVQSSEEPALLLAYGNKDNYEALLVIELDKDGKVSRIEITRDSKYNVTFGGGNNDNSGQKSVVDIYVELASKNFSNDDEANVVRKIKYLDDKRDGDLINMVYAIVSGDLSANGIVKELNKLALPSSSSV